tara:strand:+ start:1349 stop:1951 length:603 start_codon:yes stop_codon:yes gene_type:complete
MASPFMDIKRQIKTITRTNEPMPPETTERIIELTDAFTERIYNEELNHMGTVKEKLDLLINRGQLPDGSVNSETSMIYNALEYYNKNDFTIFVILIQLLARAAGSLVLSGGRKEVISFLKDIQSKLPYELIESDNLPDDSTMITIGLVKPADIILQKSNLGKRKRNSGGSKKKKKKKHTKNTKKKKYNKKKKSKKKSKKH